ncbi:4546_t:CDS:2 [Ambispora leptoticha]|uniref:4546_t:CDS:1 n=1 Tax=Ambispora leptoticha TaxID=144679 RepID=A0A9N9C4R1_9GLOM|nr:4546_t:CDS:2 [Ambispora leptoticha]
MSKQERKNKSSSKKSNQNQKRNYNLKIHALNEKSSTNYSRYDASPLSMSSSSSFLLPTNNTIDQTVSSSIISIKPKPSKNTHVISSSLQVTKTLLGVPDGNIPTNHDTDPYVTKIGGIPNWLASSSSTSSPELSRSSMPSFDVAICGNCGKEMFLLFQGYVPLDRSSYDRVIYVWGCNQKRCMRKSGSFRAIRAHQLNKEYAQQLRQDKEKYANAIVPPAFNLKELISSIDNHDNHSNIASLSVPSIEDTTTTNDYEYPRLESTVHRKISEISPSKNEILPNNHKKSDSLAPSKNWSQIVSEGVTTNYNKDEKASPHDINDLSDRIQKLGLVVDSSSDFLSYKEWPRSIPYFPAQYLYITEEILGNTQSSSLLKKYEHYLNYEDYNNYEADGDRNLGEWAGEKYEKSVLPKGVDKAFRKFSERVAEWPDQCVRYEFGGQPLLYNQNYLTRIPPCKNCGKDRVFEFQLMPNILYALSTSHYAKVQGDDHNNIYQFDLGMEWGTVMIFTCMNDCNNHANDVNENNNTKTSYYEEYVFVQYEDL